jgi:hypothetical protein
MPPLTSAGWSMSQVSDGGEVRLRLGWIALGQAPMRFASSEHDEPDRARRNTKVLFTVGRSTGIDGSFA